MATNLGIWYVQIPNGFVINPMGQVVGPKIHNGSTFVFDWKKKSCYIETSSFEL